MPAVLPVVQKVGLRRGLLGGSRAWTALAVAAIGLRLLQRLTKDEPEVSYREELAPGQSLLITHGHEPRG